jgi:hypothetical protein
MNNDEQDRIQRALNDAKRRELEEKYGGIIRSNGPGLPPDLEADWLHHIEEFEREFEAAEQTTVRHFLGDPSFPPPSEVAPEDLQSTLDRFHDLLADHNIEVHFGQSISDQEMYRFLFEELLDQEIDDIHVEGMTQNFIYEEFHPDDREEAILGTKMFLHGLYSNDRKDFSSTFAGDGSPGPDGTTVNHDLLYRQAELVSHGIATFLNLNIKIDDCSINGNFAVAKATVDWEGLRILSMALTKGRSRHTVHLSKDEFGWLVAAAELC